MNNPTLIIYANETGCVWHIQNGVEEIPSGNVMEPLEEAVSLLYRGHKERL